MARAAGSRASDPELRGRLRALPSVEELASRYREGEVPRPPHWGGFVLAPDEYEFWQHRDDRLHDRFRYRREAGSWTIERLAP